MRLFVTEGDVCEGTLHDLWPLIRRPRLVANGLQRKGMVTFGDWWDETGYELHLTPAGRAYLDPLGELERSLER